jgi:hypothetical protein
MLNSYPIYNPTTNNLRRNSLNSTLSLAKYRRNSFSPSTPLILSQSTFEDFHDDYFPNTSETKMIESNANFYSEPKDDANLSFLTGLDLANNNNNDNLSLPDLSTPQSIVSSSSQSTIQCVRIIRRNDTAPIQTNSNSNQRRVVRVIRLSNAARSTEQTSSSNVYIVRKSDLTPSVQINPALKDVIAKANHNHNIDENNQINKFYGSTISIFGIEFTVVSNENNNNTDKCASLVQNMNDSTVKPNVQITNKVFFWKEKKNS